jgi:lantibiotic leader peptide-processing serine protease
MQLRRIISLAMALVMALSATSAIAVSAAPAHDTANQNYLIVYAALSVPKDAATSITRAGGTLLYRYNAIGVVVASSSSSNFRSTLMQDSRIQGVDATGSFATQLSDGVQANDNAPDPSINAPAPGMDSLSSLQWDMAQMHAFEAHAITGGSPSVVVGDIDTGLDYTHPDLAANVDFADSVSCVGGVPNTDPSAWKDDNGHGTHTAGTIAAARNGIGIVGVAPNVKIAGIKAGDAAGFFFPEAVVCAFMWAGSHHISVTNNSYFADPWLFACRNDVAQRAIWSAERRAIQYAMSRGTVVVAAEGNQADDLTHPTQDATSPDDTNPVLRQIHNDCAVVPVEVPGVIGVTATGNLNLKSFYSSYGIGTVQVAAPGGDSVLQLTAAAPNGRVLSTWPSYLGCSRKVVENGAVYCYLQGTSMASPHAAGLAALLISQGVAPSAVGAMMQNTADPLPCPDTSVYSFFPAVDNGALQTCTGGPAYTAF